MRNPDNHTRLLDELMATHTLFGAFDATADVFELHQLWEAPPADERLLPQPGQADPWANLAIRSTRWKS